MSGNNSSSKMVVVRSADGEMFEIEEAVAMESQTIKHMIEDNCANSTIPLPNVTSKILVKIIEYCKYHAAHASKQNSKPDQKPLDESDSAASVVDELKKFDEEYVKVDHGTLFEIILAANYLNIQSLLDLTCQTVANMIKGKTGQQIRKMFNIKNDFTAAEEAEIMRENAWAFE